MLKEFIAVRSDFQKEIDVFPKEKRLLKLFDNWSIKDMISHINGWDVHTLYVLTTFKLGKIPQWGEETEAFNKKEVLKRKGWLWDRVYKEFLTLDEQLVQEYTSMPDTLWLKNIWPHRDFTPMKYLEIDIGHFRKHGEQITKNLYTK